MTAREEFKKPGNNPATYDPEAVGGQLCSGLLPGGDGGVRLCSELLTEEELIVYLRIPQISQAKDYHNVIENLKRMHDLPRIHICGQPLYPLGAIRQWIREKTTRGR